ncbi:hypothetical protein PAXRUDRAFT_245968 [Paxillus rubicundulus Ve08.2h10]|uniref:Uncharacterized protein n=1 Tax=Paxillus rubicundulus Ve08.2h10 TaxID=930991 RepID=A0A0D0CBF6_9AGAM|nr:hypothetical protein PAXRUDRAFT_245968 [Paxillus rubicundulus Ve08.2h10]
MTNMLVNLPTSMNSTACYLIIEAAFLFCSFSFSMRYIHDHQFVTSYCLRQSSGKHTRRRSSFLLAISAAFSSLDIPAMDFGTVSVSTGRECGDEIGVGRELDAGETAVGLLDGPLDLRL